MHRHKRSAEGAPCRTRRGVCVAATLLIVCGSGCSSRTTDLKTAARFVAEDLAPYVPRHEGSFVAVSDLLTAGRTTYLGQRAADYISDCLHDELGTLVVDRRDLAQQLTEHQFQWSDFAFDERIVAFGQKTPATVIVTGTLERYDDEAYDLRCRLLDLRSGRMLARSAHLVEVSEETERDLAQMPVEHTRSPIAAPPVDRQLRTAAERLATGIVSSIQRQNLTGLSVAVGALRGPDGPGETRYGKALLQFMQNELQIQGQPVELRLLARRDLGAVLEMQRIEHTPFFDEDKRAALDKSEGAQATLYGHVERVGRAMQVTIELTDLETKAILHTDSMRVPYGAGQDELMQSAGP